MIIINEAARRVKNVRGKQFQNYYDEALNTSIKVTIPQMRSSPEREMVKMLQQRPILK